MTKPKRTPKQAGSSGTPEKSKTSSAIEIAPSFRRSAKAHQHRAKEIKAAVDRLEACWGDPHRHRGLGLRRLHTGQSLHELRVGLDLRIAFRWDDRGFVLLYCGTHDEIQAWIKNTR